MSNSYNMKEFSSTAVITENGIYPSTISINTINTKCKETELQDDGYDPFQNRKLEHPNSDARSFANLLKSSLGSGILAMPAAFKNAGSVVGIFGTIVLGYICTHCVYLLVKTSQDVSKVTKVPSLGYAETVEAVFATGPQPLRKVSKASRIFIDWAMAFTILGACAVYVILLVESVKQIIDHFYEDNGINETMYCLYFLVPLLLFTQIKNLKYLAPFSGFANILLVVTFLICLYYIFGEFPDVTTRPTSVDIGKLPLFIGTVIFAMEGIGVVLPVENTMAKPQHFLGCPGVLNITMAVVVLLYMFMGFLGYIRYGDAAQGSITLNLPTGKDEIPALMAKCFIVLAIFFTYTLQFYVPMEIVWRNTKQHVTQKYHNVAQAIMRALFSALTVAAAATLPKLEQVIGLEGAFFYSFLGLIAILDLVFHWERDLGKYNWILIKDVLLIIFGTFVLVTGVTQSIREIVRTT